METEKQSRKKERQMQQELGIQLKNGAGIEQSLQQFVLCYADAIVEIHSDICTS